MHTSYIALFTTVLQAPRRNVSLAGEKVAERTVLQQKGGQQQGGDGAVADAADHHQAYYRYVL